MVGAIVFLLRLVAGVIMIGVVWFVLDTIHDRNTEIIVAVLGLMYAFHLPDLAPHPVLWAYGFLLFRTLRLLCSERSL